MKHSNKVAEMNKSPINSIPPSGELNLKEFAKRMTKGMIASINREIEEDEKFDREHKINEFAPPKPRKV